MRAGARVGRKLRVSPAAEIVYIARLRLVDGEPMAVEYLHVPAELVPGLRAADMESGDFYACLRERHGVLVHEAVQSIEPTVANEEEARLLQVPVLSPRCSSTASPAMPPAAPWSTCTPSTAATATASSPACPSPARPPRACP